MAREISLEINGVQYNDWTTATVSQSIGGLAFQAVFQAVDRWRGRTMPFKAADPAVVRVGREKYGTGRIDSPDIRYDARSHALTLSIRSRTGDLEDCSAERKTGKWKKAPPKAIIESLIEDYGIELKVEADLGRPLDRFAINDGESVAETIKRVLQARGVIGVTDADGALVLTNPAGPDGQNRVREPILGPGGNVLAGGVTDSILDRYSQIVVKGQSQGRKDFFGDRAALGTARALDQTIPLFRPLLIVSSGTVEDMQNQADFERNVRFGRGRRASYTVAGFQDPDNAWRINRLVRVVDNETRLDEDLLIDSVSLTESASSKQTSMELVRKEAYLTEPPPPKRGGRGL